MDGAEDASDNKNDVAGVQACLQLLGGVADLDPHAADPAALLTRIEAYRTAIARTTAQLAARGDTEAAAEGPYAPGLVSSDPGVGAGALPSEAAASAHGGALATHRQEDEPGSDPPTAANLGDAVERADGPAEWAVPPHCVPIHANVTTFDWAALAAAAQFDVVMMDPPWGLSTPNPTRGVALGYSQLSDEAIGALPVPGLQRDGGLLFVWVINAKYKFTLDLFDRWGYELVDEVVWVKTTVNRRLFKSHGYYLQHAKEVCLVGCRGAGPPSGVSAAAAAGAPGGVTAGVCSDVILSERRGQSQKPQEIYELIEALVPNGRYLEIFARRNNLRDYWVSIGNEVGVGLPESDLAALRAGGSIPGAKYGRGAG